MPDALTDAITGGWGLALMSLLVLGDAFFVVVPGEIAVTTLGALSAATGSPRLWAVIVCAAIAAACGDLLCYTIGRLVGLDRWHWMRTERALRARRWAHRRLSAGTATVLFTARFIPFARLAINLVAGASRIPLPRYIGLVLIAATGWATYQAAIGAVIATLVPGGPVVAILISIVTAITLGAVLDAIISRISRRRSEDPSPVHPD